MLLGIGNAAYLLGTGDLLFKDIGNPRRMQGVCRSCLSWT